jgi:Ca-activated chloride channel homolog
MFGHEFTRLSGADVATIAAVGAGLVVLWFFLRPRPPVVTVSSHVLWEQVLPKRRDPLIKELIMLALQLLAVAGLAVALGDPQPVPLDVSGEDGAQQRLWLVDRSLSMGADNGDGSRIHRVTALLQTELDTLPEGVDVGLVGAAETPELLAPCGEDRQRLRLALRMLDVSGVRSDLDAALELAIAQPGLEEGAVLELWTDDVDAALAVDKVREQGWDVRVRSPFGALPNAAITAFDLRASEGIPAEEEAIVRIRNHSPWPARLVLGLETADAVLGEAEVAIEPNGEVLRRYRFQPLDVTGVEAVLRDVRFETEDGILTDALAADDRAFGWLQPVRPLSAVLVSDGNRYLERVLALLPGVKLTKVAPSAWGRKARAAAESADIAFLDGFVPPGRPLPRVFYVAPPAGGPFAVQQAIDSPQVTDWNPDHPLFGGLVLRDLTIRVGELFDEKDGDVRLIGTPDGALALARDGGPGQRAIAWGFDFGQSDLPLRLAFPQIIVNALLWMREGRASEPPPGGRHPVTSPLWLGPEGPADADPAEGNAAVSWTDLRRVQAALARGDERGAERATQRLSLSAGLHPLRFPAPGLYRLDGPGWRRDLAVNLPQVAESDLRPLPTHDDRPVATAPDPPEEEAPSMPWLLLGLGAAALFVTEFGLYTR